MHSNLDGSSLAHAIQVPMGPLLKSESWKRSNSRGFTSVQKFHTHTPLCPFRLSVSCVSQKVAGKACSPWNADSGGLNFKSKTRGIWETTSNYHESKWTRCIDFLASLGVLFIGLRRKCPLWGQSSSEDTHPPLRGHLEKDSEGWFVQGKKSERNVKDIWWKIGKGWFLWLLCNILMTYGKLWIIINYVNSMCLLLEPDLFLRTATDCDLVHWECISIYYMRFVFALLHILHVHKINVYQHWFLYNNNTKYRITACN